MAGCEVRCPCGGEPHVFPLHLHAARDPLRIRAVEMGLRRPDQPLPSLCGECILERLCNALVGDDDLLGEAEEADDGEVDAWIDGIRERMAREEHR
jgi:hypothetical protein